MIKKKEEEENVWTNAFTVSIQNWLKCKMTSSLDKTGPREWFDQPPSRLCDLETTSVLFLMCPSRPSASDLWLGSPAPVCLEGRASSPACTQQRESIRNPLIETLRCQSRALCNIWDPVLRCKHLTAPIRRRMLLCCCMGFKSQA